MLGVPLQKAVLIIGYVELGITIIATILNVIRYNSAFDSYGDECAGKDVCIGPLIKYAVLDGFTGVVCSLMLIFGAKRQNKCLLILWMLITFCISIKYTWVVFTHDWTSLEDWISITYLLFYALVVAIIFSFFKDTNRNGIIHEPTPVNNENAVLARAEQSFQKIQEQPLQHAYNPQQGYQPQQGFPQQQLYAQQPAYAPQQGYPPPYPGLA